MSVPDLIGRYRLGPRLGSGGFAVVWLAHDESLDTDIAIKVMADNWSDRMDLRERFLMEARMLRRAASNRIVQVFDIGELPDGRPYFVMEHADRGTLADRAKLGPMPMVTALRVTAEVARGAAELHRAGIVHRDLKPSNVLIQSSKDGPERLLIADLGVAKNLAQASGLTMSVGSAGFMAPEQSGPNSGVEARADVYSLGAIAYRLITGEVPGLPGYVNLDRPELPPPVRMVLQRALEVNQEHRWPDATTFSVQLDQVADRITSPPSSAPSSPYPAPSSSTPAPSLLYPAPSSQPSQFSQPPQFSEPPQFPQPSQFRQSSSSHPRRVRPVRRIFVTLAVLIVLVGTLGLTALYRNIRSNGPVQVENANATISLEVPRSWAKELVQSGWDPGLLKLNDAEAPGLIVSNDAQHWNDLDLDVNGVLVGLSDDPKLLAAVKKITHSDCDDAGDIDSFTTQTWSATGHKWTNCGAAGGTLLEIGLTNKGDSSTRAYLQIRQDSDDDAAQQIVSNLQTDWSEAAEK